MRGTFHSECGRVRETERERKRERDMQIVLNPQRVRLSNLCPWAASWVGCREELQQGKVADSRLLALLWSLALPAGTHLQLNRPDWLTD